MQIPFNQTGYNYGPGSSSSGSTSWGTTQGQLNSNSWLPVQMSETNPITGLTQSTSPGSQSSIPSSPYAIPGLGGTSGAAPTTNPVFENNLTNKTLPDLQNLYGEGLGQTIYNYLAGGAGYNSQVAQALIAQMQPQIQAGENDITSRFGAAGMGNSSEAALGLSSFLSNSALDENSILANLYGQSNNIFAQLLGGIGGQAIEGASGPSWESDLGSILGGAGGLLGNLGIGGEKKSSSSSSGFNLGGILGSIGSIVSLL